MDQKIIANVIVGGTAIVAAAVGLYYLINYNNQMEKDIEEDYFELLDLDRDEKGKITFDCFL